MIEFILIALLVYLVAKLMNTLFPQPLIAPKQLCPPHQWSWVEVYNEDGSIHHKHMVCAKCGPIHGEVDV